MSTEQKHDYCIPYFRLRILLSLQNKPEHFVKLSKAEFFDNIPYINNGIGAIVNEKNNNGYKILCRFGLANALAEKGIMLENPNYQTLLTTEDEDIKNKLLNYLENQYKKYIEHERSMREIKKLIKKTTKDSESQKELLDKKRELQKSYILGVKNPGKII